MSNNVKNIEKLEENLAKLTVKIEKIAIENSDRLDDLQLLVYMIENHAGDLAIMKHSLKKNPEENDTIYRIFLEEINEFIVNANKLLIKSFKLT